MHLLLGAVSAVLLVFFTLLFGLPAAFFGVIKLVFPKLGKHMSPIFEWLVIGWSSSFTGWLALFSPGIEVKREGTFYRDKNYMIVANHQTWVDIFVLLIGCNRTIPSTRFFMKRELLWLPLVGFVAWSMDFPVMRRHSREYLAKHPEKRGSDLATVRKACEKFKEIPVSVVNFSEGTRSTPEKRQASHYKHLLPPKAGGVATVLAAVGDHLDYVMDGTIDYPDGVPTFWEWMCGRAGRMKLHMQTVDLPEVESVGESGQISASTREKVKTFLVERWDEKEKRLEEGF